jgi:1-acyl-sn-glycerol-3-phosphate acyltransferase
MSPVADLRASARTAGFVGLTFSLLGCLEADLRTAPALQRAAVTYKWMARYGRNLLRLYGLQVATEGPYLERGAPYPAHDARGKGRIFVMNHRSMLDILVDLAFVEANAVSRADLADWPVIGLAARRVGTFFVDRTDKRSGTAVINAMVAGVEEGRGVLVYPEGTTFAGDEVRPFRAGAFLAAQRADAEIVPLGIAYGGAGASFLEETFPQHYRRIASSSKTQIALVAGEPFRLPGADVTAIEQRAHAEVQALVRRARGLLGE